VGKPTNFKELVKRWQMRVKKAKEAKEPFDSDAKTAMDFYTGNAGEIFNSDFRKKVSSFFAPEDANVPTPMFRGNVNKVFEVKSVIGPYLYHANPNRRCTLRPSPDLIDSIALLYGPEYAQIVQQERTMREAVASVRARLMEAYLNYTPNEMIGGGLKTHARLAVDEALIKGRGVLWTELVTWPDSEQRMVSSTFDTVDNLLIDADTETLQDAGFVIRRRIWPKWKVEEVFELPPGEVKGDLDSSMSGTNSADTKETDRKKPNPDLVVFYEIFSKIGLGYRLSSLVGKENSSEEEDAIDLMIGDFVYLVVTEGSNFFLNLYKPETMNVEEIANRLAWPTPFWAEGSWPFALLDFHQVPRSPWPMSHIRPALSELKAIDWIFSFLVSGIAKRSRDIIAMKTGLEENLKTAIQNGSDLTMVEVDGTVKSIKDSIEFLQHPEMNQDLWKVMDLMMQLFERRTGLMELMYGQGAMRSAEEASLKGDRSQIRITAMANQVEDWMTEVSRLEALAAWYHLEEKDIQPVLGTTGAFLWNQTIRSQTREQIMRELDFRIEAGSVKKPNQEQQIANMTASVQTILPILMQFFQITPQAVNQINALLTDWAKAQGLDPSKYLVSMQELIPAPPVVPPTGEEGNDPNGSSAEKKGDAP
jgi:hypothetical protein